MRQWHFGDYMERQDHLSDGKDCVMRVPAEESTRAYNGETTWAMVHRSATRQAELRSEIPGQDRCVAESDNVDDIRSYLLRTISTVQSTERHRTN
ncbi:hypothetical protein BHM03_00029921 [Ensete ventricosum]|nr:hypothetical protein BHM03_00029921 [Ensete ventricosum]